MRIFSFFMLILFTSCNLVKEESELGAKWYRKDDINNSFTPRKNFGTAVIDNKIIIIGGIVWKNSQEELANDVWISEDEGITWEKIKENTISPTDTFMKRQKFGTVVIGKDIYVIGGYSDSATFLNDVWKSSDYGKTWVEVTRLTPFNKRYGHKAVVIKNDIYVIGGYDGRAYYNDVWKSDNLGQNWYEVDSPIKPREGFGVINYKDEILLIGGKGIDIFTDVWRSEEKLAVWYKQPNIPFEFYEQEFVEVAGDLFVIEQEHVWKSIDEGMTWGKVLFEIPFEERTGYGMVNIGQKLILFGGISSTGNYLNDVWESEYYIP